ncbi:acyl carrier protein [Oharaeibacter diazotrophicus]|uniref:acyl carrier protein n=1 Tax=Oharaeibacter diazotrophicus TaxID=1920512 RepID=UPI000F820941|nr:acyl carrier protein [Oharaeibacter diazotrophicus]
MEREDVDLLSFREELSTITGIPLEDVAGTSRVNFDLGVDGDDAVVLIERLTRRFGPPSRHVEVGQYFGPENFFLSLASRMKGRKMRPLTVADLHGMWTGRRGAVVAPIGASPRCG